MLTTWNTYPSTKPHTKGTRWKKDCVQGKISTWIMIWLKQCEGEMLLENYPGPGKYCWSESTLLLVWWHKYPKTAQLYKVLLVMSEINLNMTKKKWQDMLYWSCLFTLNSHFILRDFVRFPIRHPHVWVKSADVWLNIIHWNKHVCHFWGLLGFENQILPCKPSMTN